MSRPDFLTPVLLAAIAILSGACRGEARLTFTELDYARIIPEAPHLRQFKLQECYYHTDDAGDLYLTMRHENVPLVDLLAQEVRMSIRLRAASPSVSGNYPLTGGGLLGVWQAGPQEYRFRSYRGVAAVNAHRDGHLTGAIRAAIMLVGQQLLGGWSRPRTFHVVGTFHAVPNQQAGPAIDEECLAGPYDRRPTGRFITTKRVIRKQKTTTRPATTQSGG